MSYTEIQHSVNETVLNRNGYTNGITVQFDPTKGNIQVYDNNFDNVIFQEVDGKKEWLGPAETGVTATDKNLFEAIFTKDINKIKENGNEVLTPNFVKELNGTDIATSVDNEDEKAKVFDPELYKGIQKSDRVLQRLSLRNLKYPIDADYGNTQDLV